MRGTKNLQTILFQTIGDKYMHKYNFNIKKYENSGVFNVALLSRTLEV